MAPPEASKHQLAEDHDEQPDSAQQAAHDKQPDSQPTNNEARKDAWEVLPLYSDPSKINAGNLHKVVKGQNERVFEYAHALAMFIKLQTGYAQQQLRFFNVFAENFDQLCAQKDHLAASMDVAKTPFKSCKAAIEFFKDIATAATARGDQKLYKRAMCMLADFLMVTINEHPQHLGTIVDCKELLTKAVDVVVNCHQKPTPIASSAANSNVTSLFADLIPKPPPRVAAPTPPAATHLNPYSDPDEAYLMDRIQSLRQNSDDIPTPVEFEQIAGMDEVKRKMRIASFYAFDFVCARPKPTPAATLLYGPPGTGKTSIVYSFAKSRSLPLFSVTAANVKGRYKGESEKLVDRLFQAVREAAPCVLFFDEAEGIFGKEVPSSSFDPNLSMFNALWGNLINDKVQVFIFGATNIPDSLAMDTGISRHFQRKVLVDLPNAAARRMVLEYALSSVSHSLTPDEVDEIAAASEGYTGNDIVKVIEDIEEEQIPLLWEALYWQKVNDGATASIIPSASAIAGQQPRGYMELSQEEKESVLVPAINSASILAYFRPAPGMCAWPKSVQQDQIEACRAWGKKWQESFVSGIICTPTSDWGWPFGDQDYL